MVNPNKKPAVKKKQFKNIDEYLRKVNDKGYDYYCNDPADGVYDKLFNRTGLNCSDSDYADEIYNKLHGKYVRENIARKATPEELEWIKHQEPVTDPEILKELQPALEWMNKYVFNTDDKEE